MLSPARRRAIAVRGRVDCACEQGRRGQLAIAVVAGGRSSSLVSGWIVPAVVVGAGAWWAAAGWQRRQRDGQVEIERIDALASWIENLRDVLIAGDQPIGAIAATVADVPAVIRPQVRRLAAGLGRQDPDIVFRRFADDIDDPLGDLVAAGLLIAVRRGARTVAVLTSLAEQARQQADRRRLVEAERAPTRREVTMLDRDHGRARRRPASCSAGATTSRRTTRRAVSCSSPSPSRATPHCWPAFSASLASRAPVAS